LHFMDQRQFRPPPLPNRPAQPQAQVRIEHSVLPPNVTVLPDGTRIEETVEEVTEYESVPGQQQYYPYAPVPPTAFPMPMHAPLAAQSTVAPPALRSEPVQETFVVPHSEGSYDRWNFPTGSKPSATAFGQHTTVPQFGGAPPPQIVVVHSGNDKTGHPTRGGHSRNPCGCCSWLLRCLCCGPLVCCIICLLVLLAIGLTAFFLWPRVPNVELLNANNQVSVQTSGFRGVWNVSVAVDNKNYIDWTFDKIETTVYDSVADQQIGNGTLSDFVLTKRTNTTISIPTTISYAGHAGDTVMAHFSQCGGSNSSVLLRYNVKFGIKGLSWLLSPSVDKMDTYHC